MAEKVKSKANEVIRIWEELSTKILSSIITDHGAYFPVADIVGSDDKLWPGKARKVWRGIVQCVDTDTLPTIQAIKLRLNGDTPDEYLDYLHRQWSDEDNARVIYHAEQMKQIGLLAKLREVGRDLASLDSVDEIGEAVQQADVGLSSITAMQTNRKGDAESVSQSAWAEVEAFDGKGVLTGLAWFDTITGGIWHGFNYWVVANYKSGKTSLMRNIALTVTGAGHAVDIFCAEGSRELFTLDCVAMLAEGLMLDRGVLTNKLRLSGLFIKRIWWKRENILSKDELECIEEARQIWEKLPIRVWDSRDGIRNWATLKHIIRKSKLDYGSRIHMVDYSQLLGGEGNVYERQSQTALMAQDISVTENIAIWMLAQRNEAAVKGDSGHSSGVKGGGDADAAADFTLIPTVDEDGFSIELKHSRHTSSGMKEVHVTNPSSGLILDKWISSDVRM
jgi:KaiC/GvpD/RAD55 family RecA-like ATPase